MNVPTANSPNNGLAKLDQATRMLAEIHTVDDAKKIINLAEAARVYAKQVELGLEAQNHAAEIKLRAQRRAGDILDQMEKSNGGRPNNLSEARTGLPATYNELNIDRRDASRWQAIARLPADRFEDYLEKTRGEGQEITTAGIIKFASHPHVFHNSGNNEWYTPPEFTHAARLVMGGIDLDPASSIEANRTIGATRFYSIEDNGLDKNWHGRIWMNPPYADGLVEQFTSKLIYHYQNQTVSEAIVLLNNATETDWFQALAKNASAICFPDGRISFWKLDGAKGKPLQGQAILYLGLEIENFITHFQEFGFITETI